MSTNSRPSRAFKISITQSTVRICLGFPISATFRRFFVDEPVVTVENDRRLFAVIDQNNIIIA